MTPRHRRLAGLAATIRVTARGASFGMSADGRRHPLDKTVEGTSSLQFKYGKLDASPLRAWLEGVLATAPVLTQCFNGRLLQPALPNGDAPP